MDRFERLASALAGRRPDRIPTSVWFHFGSEHLPPAETARLHVAFYRAYRWDFLKIMFDYRAEIGGASSFGSALDLDDLIYRTDWRAPFALQQECIEQVLGDIGNEVPLVETIYSPWMYLLRHVGLDQKSALLKRPDLTEEILLLLTEETVRHIAALHEMHVPAIYFATLAGQTPVGEPDFAPQSRHDLVVLAGAEGMDRLLHLHGSKVDPGRVEHYPRELLHCDDRDPENPDLSGLRKARDSAIMGGLASSGLTAMSPLAISGQIADAIARAGADGFILAPGCSVSPSLSRRTMMAIRDSPLLDTAPAPKVPA